MRLTITINTDNVAFEDNRDAEIARILRRAADTIERGDADYPETLRDFNGNRVGIIESN